MIFIFERTKHNCSLACQPTAMRSPCQHAVRYDYQQRAYVERSKEI